MSEPDLVIRGRRVVLPGEIVEASMHIREGRISTLAAFDEVPPGCEIVEADKNSLVMPGLVDTHVHVNEPGRTDWEGFATATRAAAAGGVTTIVDMPLNSIPATTTLDSLQAKLASTRGKLHVDAAFWGGVVPGNTDQLSRLWDAGVVGFKCFLIHSGVDEFPDVSESHLREAMPELARLGATLIVHAELPGPIENACCSSSETDADSSSQTYQTFLNSRPRQAENQAVELMIRLSRETGCRIHIVHHSSADGATEFKCCPPIRERENREQLWQALGDGTIDMVVSDHSPCPAGMKLKERGDFMKAWGGISSLQLRLPIMWTEANKRGFTLTQLTEWLCSAPARQVGLAQRKGSITVGSDADIVIWNPEREFQVVPELIHHRHKLTPYAGELLRGVVEKTFLRGEIVYDDGEFSEPRGESILRGRH
jgi:allantoinase